MRFLLIAAIIVFMALISIGIATKLEKPGEDWNSPFWNTEEDDRNGNLQSRSIKEDVGTYEKFGYTLARETRMNGENKLGKRSELEFGSAKVLSGIAEVAGTPEVDGSLELDGQADCKSRICDVATCECVDNWDLFSQTCNLLDKQFCTANVMEVVQSTDESTYYHTFEAMTHYKDNAQTTIHVITTDQPIFDETFDYGSYAITGKMRTYNLDGTAYCMDDYLSEGIDTDDCWYDVRIMGNQPLCPKKRTFFNIANHADVMIQLRYQSDLERGEPSMMKPPFTCMRLCNPLIESSTERGFIAANPGRKLQKCVPQQIEVDRIKAGAEGENVAATVLEAQILLNAANNQKTIGQQWNVYHLADKTMDNLAVGVDNDDLITSVESLKDEYRKCDVWLSAHKATEACDNGKCSYALEETNLALYATEKDDGTIHSLVVPGVVANLEFIDETKLGDETLGALPFEENGVLKISRKIESGKAVRKVTAPAASENEDVTIFDQTWRNGDTLNGVATIMEPLPDTYGFGNIMTCYKLCIGDYEPGNEKCNDGAERNLDCERIISEDDRMELAAMEYLWPNGNEM